MKQLLLFVKIVVTATLLWLLLRNVGFNELLLIIAKSDIRFVFAGLAVLALQPLIASLRWWVIARRVGARMSIGKAIAVTYVGTFFNQVLPATLGGDAIRIWLCYRLGIPLISCVTSVGVDRASMLLGLILLVGFGAIGLQNHAGVAEMEIVVLPLLIAAVAAIALVLALETLPAAWRKWRIVRAASALASDTRKVLFNPVIAIEVLCLSIVGFVNMTACVYFFSHALRNSLHPIDAILLVPPVILASVLPISIGGWGLREFAMVGALATVGIPSSASLAISIMFGVASIVVSLPGAVCYLLLHRGATMSGVPTARQGTQGTAP